MRPALEHALCEDFPNLYRRTHYKDHSVGSVSFDIEDGWEPLLRELSSFLEPLIVRDDLPHRAIVVKEKYGELRFYMDPEPTPEMRLLISGATRASREICEICGELGHAYLLADQGIKARCELYASKHITAQRIDSGKRHKGTIHKAVRFR